MRQLSDILIEKKEKLGSFAKIGKALGDISGQLIGKYAAGTTEAPFDFAIRWKEAFQEDLIELMFKDGDDNSNGIVQEARAEYGKRVPFFDVAADAGAGTDVSPVSQASGTLEVGDLLRDSEAAMRISGNSMIPNYPPGCVVGLIKRYNSFIEPGEVYVIETRDGRILKRIFFKDDNPDDEILTCFSDNIMVFTGGARNGKSAYPPFNLSRSEIINIYTVVGVIKRNTNSIIVNKR